MQKIPLEKHFRFAFLLFYILLGCIAAYVFFTKLLGWFLPFLLAAVFAWMADPLVGFLEKKTRVPRKLASVVSILVVVFVIVFVLWMVFRRLGMEISSLADYIPQLMDRLPSAFNTIEEKLHLLNRYVSDFGMDVELESIVAKGLENLSGILTSLTSAAGGFAYQTVKRLPSLLVAVFACLLSTYFISSDKEKILGFLSRQVPESWKLRAVEVKGYLSGAFFQYVKAQLILMTITFFELLIAFFIIRVQSPFILALIICIVDMLPVLGTGTILIPWALFSLLLSDYKLALGLVITYAVCLVMRQLLKPKIVSGQIGIHPLLTLMALYIGLKTMGIFGMLVGVILMIIVVNLHRSGVIKIWK